MSMLPHDEAPAVGVVAVGGPDRAVREAVAALWADEFGATTTDLGSVPVPESVPEDDEPVLLGDLLDAAAEAGGEDHDFVVGVTDLDVRTAGREFVFGYWNRREGVGLLSTARLSAGDPSPARARERLRTVVLNGAGALFGFYPHEDCVLDLARSAEGEDGSVGALDDVPAEFCEDCTERLTRPDTAPAPPEWRAATVANATASRWEEGDVRLVEYPFYVASEVVAFVVTLPIRLGGDSPLGLPRPVRALGHESYRAARFWWKVLLFFGAYLVVAAALFGVLGVDTDAPGALAWGLLVASLPLGWLVYLVVDAVVVGVGVGLFVGVVEGVRSALRGRS